MLGEPLGATGPGRERGVKTPVSTAVIETMREVEAGTRGPSPANIEASLKRAGV